MAAAVTTGLKRRARRHAARRARPDLDGQADRLARPPLRRPLPVRHRLRLEPRGAGEPRLPVGGTAGRWSARRSSRCGPSGRRTRPASTASIVGFEPAWALPKPVQQPLPVHLGGGWGPKLFDAICEYGAGWMPISARPSLASRIALLQEACERNGRDPATVAISVFGATTDPAASRPSPARASPDAVLTLPYEADDVVLPLLDEWAPARRGRPPRPPSSAAGAFRHQIRPACAGSVPGTPRCGRAEGRLLVREGDLEAWEPPARSRRTRDHRMTRITMLTPDQLDPELRRPAGPTTARRSSSASPASSATSPRWRRA